MAGRPRIDLNQKISDLLTHSEERFEPSEAPIRVFESRTASAIGLMKYIKEHLKENVYRGPCDRHMTLQRRLILVTLIEAFERFLKDLAIVCVDLLAPVSSDDRFDEFSVTGSDLALHFQANAIGKAMCESDTWLSNARINDRFRQLLKEPYGERWGEFLFPNQKQRPESERLNATTLAMLWQVRHSITHNSGELTSSDAARLKLLARADVPAERVLAPTDSDLSYVQRFLNELAVRTNERIAKRLADVLSEFQQLDAGLFEAQVKANEVSSRFCVSVAVGGVLGTF